MVLRGLYGHSLLRMAISFLQMRGTADSNSNCLNENAPIEAGI